MFKACKKQMFLLTFILIFIPGSAPARVLTWQDCVDQTVKSNPELEAAEKELHRRKLEQIDSYSSFFPQLTASAGMSKAGSYINAGSGIGEFRAGDINYSFSLSANQKIFSGFTHTANIVKTQALVCEARSILQETRAKIAYELKEAFASLAFALRQTELAKEIEKRRKDNVELVELRFQAGLEHKGALLYSKAQAAQAQIDVLRLGRDVELAAYALTRVLNNETSEQVSISGNLQVEAPEKKPNFNLLFSRSRRTLRHLARAKGLPAGTDRSPEI